MTGNCLSTPEWQRVAGEAGMDNARAAQPRGRDRGEGERPGPMRRHP